MAVVPFLSPSDGSYRLQQKRNGSIYMYRARKSLTLPLQVFSFGLIIDIKVRHVTPKCNQETAVNRAHFRTQKNNYHHPLLELAISLVAYFGFPAFSWQLSGVLPEIHVK